MYCSKCGKPISEDSVFCMYCGAKLEESIVYGEDINTNKLTNSDNTINEQDLNSRDMNYQTAAFITRLSTLWSGRMNRKNYFLGTLLLNIAFFPCFFIKNDSLIIAIGIIIYLACVILSARRLHDIDKTGGWAFFISVPVIGFFLFLYLIFKRGTSGENQYGPEPL